MKKKSFYNNKKRNTKWTEPVKGRKIYFADKYIDDGTGSDKFNNRRKKEKKPFFTRKRAEDFLKYAIVAVCSFAIISVGYTAMDFYIQRRTMPLESIGQNQQDDLSSIKITVKSQRIDSLSLDGGVMLSAVIDDVVNGGYSSVTFDLKRDDGTIGYDSSLATVDMYDAEASIATDLEKSVSEFVANDILPIGRISCYKDNVAAGGDLTSGITVNGKLYRDSDGNNYLSPKSENAYNYIKSIVEEAKNMGVSVFVLDNCSLPDELTEIYGGGYKNLVSRLQNDFGSDVKFLEGVSVSITSDNKKGIEQQWNSIIKNNDTKNKIITITAKDSQKVKEYLDNKNVVNYIISK